MAAKGPGRVIYVVGPSGAGKDTLLAGARAALADRDDVHFIQRHITRPADAGGEDHHPVTPTEFEARLAEGAYVLWWRAHDFAYAIPAASLLDLGAGDTAVISGSRAAIGEARSAFGRVTIVHITASRETLRIRLLARGRESAAQVEERLDRALAHPVSGPDVIEISNAGAIEAGVASFLRAILGDHPSNG